MEQCRAKCFVCVRICLHGDILLGQYVKINTEYFS